MAAEALLQYLWEHRLWEPSDLITTSSHRIVVLDPGRRNTGAGPDFFNAKVQIGHETWVGNVEIHVRASDWHRHGHQNDHAYDSVILHVVAHSDTHITRPDGSDIPQMILSFTPEFRRRYDAMVGDRTSLLPCMRDLADIPRILITDWITSLGYERLYDKVARIDQLHSQLDHDWQATAYVTLARALGFSINNEPFERLATATPLRFLLKHRDDPAILEAALLGQAGFLQDIVPETPEDVAYADLLRAHYHFLKAKYDLHTLESPGWKMGRMRPANFPHRRIAALAAMVADGFRFGRQFSHISSLDEARELLGMRLSGYWNTHYTFGRASASAPSALSRESVDTLIINVVVPLLYAYGQVFADDSRMALAVELLQRLAPERNSVVSVFTDAGFVCDDAFTSQALIQLRRVYCEPRKCLYCRLGHRILARKAKP